MYKMCVCVCVCVYVGVCTREYMSIRTSTAPPVCRKGDPLGAGTLMRSELIGAGIAAPAVAQGTFINVYTQIQYNVMH